MSSVAVIDYGMGNLHSIAKALQHASAEVDVIVTADAQKILAADRVVFPGVGAMRDCMQALEALHLIDVIKNVAATKPFLGICLGMQALLVDSQENGHTDCLGIFDGHVLKFAEPLKNTAGEVLKVPHMGWNQVKQTPHPLWKNIPDNSRFYFVHSYYAQVKNPAYIAGTSDYPNAFACALMKENVFAVQFHPEKSQHVGLQLLANFLAWDGLVV
ncbi:MAG TPA: imidazole glycerol phosphate synthase subunit HisH [Methylococcaceae bacterium]|nr:imidazole glycerol phosphate synthase subunit HisH [Methylococcaceae bacterium]